MSDNEKCSLPLALRQCSACKGETEPLKGQAISRFMDQVSDDWQVIDEHHLDGEFKFKNFRQALEFVNAVGELAESQGHHPDIFLAWGKVKITLWTHKINGLSEADFILAAKVDELPR